METKVVQRLRRGNLAWQSGLKGFFEIKKSGADQLGKSRCLRLTCKTRAKSQTASIKPEKTFRPVASAKKLQDKG
jgi:hypothetical protein